MGAATRTALVTGGNRGIGLEVCRQLAEGGHRVLLGARSLEAGRKAAAALDGEVEAVELDVTRPHAADALAARFEVDILVNNAGLYPQGTVLGAKASDFEEAMAVHLFGALWTCRAFVPGMVKRQWGRVVNVSSGYGSFGEGLEGPAPYSVSKAALDALTVKLATEVPSAVKVNACCPGWVRTRMGGRSADLSVEEGASGVVWLATLPDDGPTGGFFRNREPIPW